MTRYTPLYSEIAQKFSDTKSPELIPSIPNFPFPQMYSGQKQIFDSIKPEESFCLCSHTGFGKSPVFLTMARNQATLVIEPRKFLQSQIASYFSDFVLYGRSGYPCKYAPYGSAASAPCLLKEKCETTNCAKTCKDAKETCNMSECEVFQHKDGYVRYPCSDCEYLKAARMAIGELRAGHTVIANFGNFWNLVKHADMVVVDEADLFFKSISAPIITRYTVPKDGVTSIQEMLQREVSGLKSAAASKDARLRYAATNALFNAQFFLANHELCFTYQRKDKIYIEIDPRNTNILSQKLFRGKRVIIVSATPGAFDYPNYSASIHQRCGVYFVPVGNLTSKSLKANPHLMTQAGRAIAEISDYFDMVYDNKVVIVHCGNLGTHAKSLFDVLGNDNCTLHEAGKLAETLDRHTKSGKRYLLVASAEYGLDSRNVMLQFILKFPFPTLDEKMNTLKRTMGPAFSSYYAGEARTRVIQAAGRVGRGFNDFGVTICLDSKIHEDYVRNVEKYPKWYRERVCRTVF